MPRIYHNIDEVLGDRRNEIKLSVIIENLLHSPYVLSQINTPFDLIGALSQGDYVDMSTEGWGSLPVELQMKYATAYQEWYAYHSGHPSVEGTFELVPRTEIEMMLIPPGKFRMGSPTYEVGRAPDEKQRVVNIEKAFWCGKTEVTQEEWLYVIGTDPSESKGPMKPVASVDFGECLEFCDKVKMNLLSEEQWEYACRAGTSSRFSFGDSVPKLAEYAVYGRRHWDGVCVVKSKKPNPWGLYDMHGNVREWTSSVYSNDSSYRTCRGGCWFDPSFECRSANRNWENALYRQTYIGLRVCRDV